MSLRWSAIIPLFGMLLGCRGPIYPVLYTTLEAERNTERIEALAEGTPVAEALDQVGFIPIHNPPRPSRPYFNPISSETLYDSSDRQVDVFFFVVRATSDRSDCPVIEKRPLIFSGGKLVAKDWAFLEGNLERLGRSPGWLRRVQESRPFPHCGIR